KRTDSIRHLLGLGSEGQRQREASAAQAKTRHLLRREGCPASWPSRIGRIGAAPRFHKTTLMKLALAAMPGAFVERRDSQSATLPAGSASLASSTASALPPPVRVT